MPNVALVETKPNSTDFYARFDREFEFDRYQLCSDSSLKKVLKKDCDIDIDVDAYEWIILVGSDSLKYFTKMTSITSYSGKVIEGKFLPVINPAMLSFKPEAQGTWDRSKEAIQKCVSGGYTEFVISEDNARGLQDSQEINNYIREAIEYPLEVIGLDSETTGLYPRDGHMIGISLSFQEDSGAYLDTNFFDEDTEGLLQQLFAKKLVVFHNAKFDISFFEYHLNVKINNYADTMLLHYIINENELHGLKDLAMKYTKYGDYEQPLVEWKKAYCKAHAIKAADFTYDLIPFDVMYPYAAIDAVVTLLLFLKFKKILQNKKLANVYDNILIPGTRFLADIQNNGVPFSKDRLAASQHLMQKEIDLAIANMYKDEAIAAFEEIQGKPFNPNSVVQLRKLLFDYVGLKPTGKKTDTGQNSTDAEVLTELSEVSDIPKNILDIRQKGKIKNTYLDKIIPQLNSDSRLRTNFNLHTTTSGRLSSSGKLNMQQLPRDNPIVKGCIKARPGFKIISMDLTTAEVYVAAVLAKDKALMSIFRNGGNFHSNIAHKVFGLPCDPSEVVDLYPDKRQAAKAVTFGIMYGAKAKNISEQVTKETGKYFSMDEAQEVIDDYFKEFHQLKAWIDENERFIKTNRFIYSSFGRKRRLPNVYSDDKAIAASSVRSGLNFMVQSPASDINLLGGIDMNEYIKCKGMKSRIFALVHDSILAEVPDEEIEEYCDVLQKFIQTDRGIIIPGTPIGCDFEIGDDYSFGKFEKQYEGLLGNVV